jgi:hypothetical protein
MHHAARAFGPAIRICIMHGELLRLVSLEEGTLALETTFAAGRRHQFQGILSADGSMLVGT